MARSPSRERASPGLNWTELQQGHARLNQSIRGSQLGQIVFAATFIPERPFSDPMHFQRAISSPELGFASSHASNALILPAASATQESAAP